MLVKVISALGFPTFLSVQECDVDMLKDIVQYGPDQVIEREYENEMSTSDRNDYALSFTHASPLLEVWALFATCGKKRFATMPS